VNAIPVKTGALIRVSVVAAAFMREPQRTMLSGSTPSTQSGSGLSDASDVLDMTEDSAVWQDRGKDRRPKSNLPAVFGIEQANGTAVLMKRLFRAEPYGKPCDD